MGVLIKHSSSIASVPRPLEEIVVAYSSKSDAIAIAIATCKFVPFAFCIG